MRVIKLKTVGTVTRLIEQHIQNKTRMDKLEEDFFENKHLEEKKENLQ